MRAWRRIVRRSSASWAGDRLGRGDGQSVVAHWGAPSVPDPADDPDVEHAGRPAVVPLVDGPDPPGAHDAQHPGVDQHVDVVGDGALRAVHGGGQLGHGRRPFQQEIEDRGAQRIGDRTKLPRCRHHDPVGQLVVRDRGIDRHSWIILKFWIDSADDTRHRTHDDGDDMAEVLLFHHAQGQTSGFLAFADELRRAGHTVHTPDLYDGRTFEHARRGHGLRREDRLRRGHRARGAGRRRAARRARLRRLLARRDAGAEAGADPARRPRGAAVLLAACRRRSSARRGRRTCRCRSTAWTPTRSSSSEGDVDAARALVESADAGRAVPLPGRSALFADSSLPSYDADAAALLTRRVLDFLATR